jgi:hypothetical protein
MDPNTEDEVTFNYSINGTTMTFTGDIEGTQVTMILRRCSEAYRRVKPPTGPRAAPRATSGESRREGTQTTMTASATSEAINGHVHARNARHAHLRLQHLQRRHD